MDIACHDEQALAGVLEPTSTAAGTTQLSTWVDLKLWRKLQFILNVGTVGASGTINAVIQQATSNSGTGAKVLASTKAIAQMTASGSAVISVRGSDLDVNNGFEFVNLVVTVAVASSIVGINCLGSPQVTPPTIASGESVATQIIP